MMNGSSGVLGMPFLALSLALPISQSQLRTVPELTSALNAPDPAARAAAACELREHGDSAAPAIPALAALLADGAPVETSICERRWWRGHAMDHTTPGELAASALVAIGSASYPVLDAAMRSKSWIARRHAAWALGALDEPRAVPALITALRDAEAPVREQSAWALGVIDHRDAVMPLGAALKDADPRVRQQAAWALGVIGDSQAMNGLLVALKDQDAGVRRQAAWAIGVIGR